MGIEEIFAERARAEQETADRARKNLPILAERLDWPEGTLETCIRLEDENPGWLLFWSKANNVGGFERPAGFMATREARTRTELFDPDPERLREAIRLVSES